MPGLNAWWSSSPFERYWMEITDRTDLGADLFAPKLDDGGRPYWSYNLITEVRAGDVVFHWHKNMYGTPALVGWSRATGELESTYIIHQSHGSYGRLRDTSESEPAWRMALYDYTPLLSAVTLDEVRAVEPELREAAREIREAYAGSLYLPFDFSEKRPARATQGYLVKFPAEYVEILSQLNVLLIELPSPTPTKAPQSRPAKNPGSSGYMSDVKVRQAIERHAVDAALAHYEALGYQVDNVGSTRPYDVHATSDTEARHIEVKGSTGRAESVELTIGEVDNAHGHQPTDLFIVDNIDWFRAPDGTVVTDGGEVRIFTDWTPKDEHLKITRYRYSVPHLN
ncbi:MAG: DUF3883 domain-containing protein [Actinomycetota bacterium]|nr:DUF3883 domain-containing protein [Actinomycetota bacterium]